MDAGIRALCLAALAAVLLLFAPTRQAHAYVDPSVVTYAIQTIAGVAVALSAVVGVAFRRTRKALFKAFGVDENAGKEPDPLWAVVDGGEANMRKGRPGFSAGCEEGSSGTAPGRGARTALRWRGRFVAALLVSLFLMMTLVVVAPLEIVAGASGDVLFGAADVWWALALFGLAAAVVLALAASLLRGRLFAVALGILFAIALCCYLQAMFMNQGIPAADGRPVDWWGAHRTLMVVSSVVWVAVIVLAAAASLAKPRPTRIAAVALSVALIVVQAVGAASLLVGSTGTAGTSTSAEEVHVTQDGLFEVSDRSNIIVFILDMYDTRDLQASLEVDPGVLDEMTGFVWYPDSTGQMLPTKYALPYMLTGQALGPDEEVPDYLVRRWTEGEFLPDLSATGYSIGIYSDSLRLDLLSEQQQMDCVYQYCFNMHAFEAKDTNHVDAWGGVPMLVQTALYRDLPWPLKQYFRFYTDELNQKCVEVVPASSTADWAWVCDDPAYLDNLESIGLSVEHRDEQGAFRFIHLKGAHYPFTMNELGEAVSEDETDRVSQSRGAMHIVSVYLQQLKALGVYDDSTIIITADHGDWLSQPELPDDVTSPVLLVKPAGAPDEPYRVSDARVAHEDLFATILDAAGASYADWGTPVYDVDDPDRIRYSYQVTAVEGYVQTIEEYLIDGNALDFSNWKRTGQYWDAQEDVLR